MLIFCGAGAVVAVASDLPSVCVSLHSPSVFLGRQSAGRVRMSRCKPRCVWLATLRLVLLALWVG
eukprot:10882497-Lingulodinium_polyedra.AAC.1